MNEWEARYKALSAGITDKACIDNAEKLVDTAIKLSCQTHLSLDEILQAMLSAINLLEKNDFPTENVESEAKMAAKAFLMLGKTGVNLSNA